MGNVVPSAVNVSGTTRVYAVLGYPVAQVRAPGLLNPLFADLGKDAVLVPVHVRPEAFSEVVQGLRRIENLDGMLVTVPHKAQAMKCADEVSPTARIAGAVNALRRNEDGRWYGENFDGTGFVAGLTSAGHTPAGKNIAMSGAGGAGSAIAAALLSAGAAHLYLRDPDKGRLRSLIARLGRRWPGRTTGVAGPPAPADVDIAVNATPLGMRPDDPLPFSPHLLRPGAVVVDVIMKPKQTALLTAAAELGLPILHGTHMLDNQLDLYRDFFRLDAPART
ncbi:shikimate dehydrogenase [Streptomyces sp. NBC_00893]|uniref:shikimate dehydrogenase family protein n=1 Tax=Streptomyces sp. NBC_00893 TaxID=2975862 RepID=UPI00224CF2A1|nr:shikimate dehydrogenase [Streptomyces sp. NBC_00893]MCX4851561.1 shikimate dehydrogenase [Streptomyces sp. NBC_00893]